jgi:RNA polymerase sigma factor (sigma-70 family)
VWLHSWFSRQTGSDTAALDLTAETFAQAWLSRLRFRDEADGSAGPWLFGIARHVVAASARSGASESRARERLGILEAADRRVAEVDPAADGGSRSAGGSAWGDDLDRAFTDLPDGVRSAVALRVLEEEDYADVARRLGTTPQAARVRVHRGLTALRHVLTNRSEVSR